MEGESRELSDAGVVGRRVGADGAKRQGLAPGVGAGGDAVVDGSAEELLETVGGFEVEGGVLFVADQQSLPFEGAGDTANRRRNASRCQPAAILSPRGLWRSGESLPMTGKLLSHRKVQTTARYARPARESVRA